MMVGDGEWMDGCGGIGLMWCASRLRMWVWVEAPLVSGAGMRAGERPSSVMRGSRWMMMPGTCEHVGH